MADAAGSVLLERAAELARVDDLLAGALAGAGSVALMEGPAGIGKSALLAAARDRAGVLDCGVLRARAGVLEREHAFGVARQLIGVSRSPARVPAGGAGGSPPEQLFQMLEEMHQELAVRARRRPLLVCVDDAHWADAESLRLCAFVAARIDEMPVVLLLGARAGETPQARELLATIAAAGSVLELRALSGDAVATFVAAGIGAQPDREFAAACSQSSAGNPFMLAELVRTVRAEAIEPSAANAERVRALTPAGVSHAVLVRLAQLPAAARRLAGALAVLGGSATLRDAATLADMSLEEAAAAVDALAGADVLGASQPLEFLHPLVRNAVYDDLPPSERHGAHMRAARLLDERAEDELDRVASHLLAVEPSGDGWVAERLTAAGRRALASGGCDAAIAYLRRALAEPPAPQQRGELLLSLAQAEAAGGLPQAVTHLGEALERIDDARARAEAGRSLARLFYLRGEFVLAGETVTRALAELPDESDPLARRLLGDYLAAATLHPGLRAAPDAPGRAFLAEVLSGQLPPEPQLRALVAGIMATLGQPRELVREVALTVMLDGTIEETSHGLAATFAAGALNIIGEYRLADEILTAALQRAEADGLVLGRAQTDQMLANVRFREGRLADAVMHASRAVELGQEGWRYLIGLAAPTLAFAQIERGQLAAARAAVELAEREIGEESAQHMLIFIGRGRVELAEGNHERALADLRLAGQRLVETYGVEHPDVITWQPYAAAAAHALGDRALARELAQAGLALARSRGTPRALGTALRFAAHVADAEEAHELLCEAVGVLESAPARLEYAEVLVALGCHQRRNARPSEAREPLRRGLEIARTCGAVPLAERAHEELLASGARPRKILRGGPDALTPAEQRVARMAADGLTNRQIAETLVLSTRTVEAHLAHVYTKLGVSSRRSLADVLERAPGAER